MLTAIRLAGCCSAPRTTPLPAPVPTGIIEAQGGSTFTNFFTFASRTPPIPFTDTFTGSSAATLGNPWSVVQGGFVLDGSSEAIAASLGSQTLSEALLYDLSVSDVSVSVTVNVLTSDNTKTAGVIARANADASNSYYAFLDGSGTLHLGKRFGGVDSDLASMGGVSTGQQHTIRLDVINNTLNLYLDGASTPTLTATDSTPLPAGSVGMRGSINGIPFTNFSVSAAVAQGSFTVTNDQATAGGSAAIGSLDSTLTNVDVSATILNIGSGGVALLAQWSGNLATGTGFEAIVSSTGAVSILYVTNGVLTTTVASATLATLPTTPFTLSFAVNNGSLELFINGNQVLSGTDSTDTARTGEAGIASVLGGSIFSNIVATGL